MKLKILAATVLATLVLSTIHLVNNNSRLESEPPTIFDWQTCIERTMIQTCDLDDPLDRADCYNAANTTSKCYSESSPEASQSCTHWWIYFETAKSDDILPDSFFECAQDCMVYAKENNFYFQQYFSPMWITCSLPNTRPN